LIKIINQNSKSVSVCAHAIKSVLGIKFSRANQRHAIAMGFTSANHLLEAVKLNSVSCDLDEYLEVLKKEMLVHHQVPISEGQIKQLQGALSVETDLKDPQ